MREQDVLNAADAQVPWDKRSSRPSLCYFLVCYKKLEYVRFLLSALYRPEDIFIIHCDAKAPGSLKNFVAKLAERYPNILLLASQSYSWAGFSHVRLSFQAISLGLSSTQEWSHFLFLSEEHLPLGSPETIVSKLTKGRSAFRFVAASQYGEISQADIRNRFATVFRELPGVGCFATSIRDNTEELFARAYHGSNWIILSRNHCAALRAMAAEGALDLYEGVVHAEELAIPTLLSKYESEIENIDRVIVAFPHLTDNHSLIMTDDLFSSSYENPELLFIRKRTSVLSSNVLRIIKSNHMHEIGPEVREVTEFQEKSDASDRLFHDLRGYLDKEFKGAASAEMLDRRHHAPSPQVHFLIRHTLLPSSTTIRILSECLEFFKVAIVQEDQFNGMFAMPTLSPDCIRSTLRVRVYGLFGNIEILPNNLPSSGFIKISNIHRCHNLFDLIFSSIKMAIDISKQ